MTKRNYDIQGRIAKVLPYDFRMPKRSKLRRWYDKGGPMFVPKVFGAGWDLNFAHRGTQALLVLTVVGGIVAALLG